MLDLKTSVCLSVFCALSLGVACRADTVFLNTGEQIEGTVLVNDRTGVVIKTAGGKVISFRRADVDVVVKEEKKAAAPAPPAVLPKAALAPTAPPTKAAESADKTVEADQRVPADGATAAGAVPVAANASDTTQEEAGSVPPNLPGFPDHAKRLDKVKEARFMALLEKMTSTDESVRTGAADEVASLGEGVLPYLAAGIQHANAEARTECMRLVGRLNGKSMVKQVIEVFYSAVPEKDRPATYQVGFLQAIKTTLPVLTGESFINVDAKDRLIVEGLHKYIDWYNQNYDRLPPQLGEPKIAPTDPDYVAKLKKARELKLERRDWPRPPLSSEMIFAPNTDTSRPVLPPGFGTRPADDAFSKTIPTLPRDSALKRPVDQQNQ